MVEKKTFNIVTEREVIAIKNLTVPDQFSVTLLN